jgi:hypothetical protein
MPILHIHTFDNGLFNYNYYPNFWVLVDTFENEKYISIRNLMFEDIIIQSINTWKTTY